MMDNFPEIVIQFLNSHFDRIFMVLQLFVISVGMYFTYKRLSQVNRDTHIKISLETMKSYQTKDFSEGIMLIPELKQPKSFNEMRNQLNVEQCNAIHMLLTTWESLGCLIYRGEIDALLVKQLYSGPIILTWEKLHEAILDIRKVIPTYYEWFEWLAILMKKIIQDDSLSEYEKNRNIIENYKNYILVKDRVNYRNHFLF